MKFQALSFLLFALTVFPACAQMVVKLCYEDATYFPWQIKDGHGLDNNLVEQAANKVGVKVEMLALPWKRCLVDIGYGAQVGGFSASYNEERASFAVYPTADGKPDAKRRMRMDGYSLFRLKGNPASWDGKQLKQVSGPVGVQLGYSVANDLRKLGVDVEESPGTPDIQLRKLVLGRVSLVALLTIEGDAWLESPEFAGKVEKLSPPLTEKPYFLIFSKEYYQKNKKLVEDLWASIAQVRESPEFKAHRLNVMKKGPPGGAAGQ